LGGIDLLLPFLILALISLLPLVVHLKGGLAVLAPGRLAGVLALVSGGLFIHFLRFVPQINAGETINLSFDWIPDFGLRLSLAVDGLSLLFALLITGIGTMVLLYASGYLAHDEDAGRFLFYLLWFMLAMLGVVLAADIVLLFIFWELTSITSFLLIAHKTKSEAARQGAFKALIITGGGGIALLMGLMILAVSANGVSFIQILDAGEHIRASEQYLWVLGLLGLAAFTKSAQTPFHIWLPDAMSAPTPASAFLHSATMVKAGVYLLARFHPLLGDTQPWFWLLTSVGMLTMLVGAYNALRQHDLKGILAYSTISQLGVLVMLLGQDSEIAFKALVVGILAHALYKSALFMVAGSIDHEAGSRDVRKLGGLRVQMPRSFWVATIAALSMAGLPPLFGFLAKETLLATVIHPDVPQIMGRILTISVVAGGAMLLAAAGMLIKETFLGKPKQDRLAIHEAPWMMWLAPAIPALISFLLSVIPEPKPVAELLAQAAQVGYGDKVKVSFALWTGINVPLLLSIVAVSLGSALFIWRRHFSAFQRRILPELNLHIYYNRFIKGIDRLAYRATRLQTGTLRYYMATMLAAVGVLLLLFGEIPIFHITMGVPSFDFGLELLLLRIFTMGLAIVAAIATVLLRRDLFAIVAMSISGLSIALIFVLEPSPDVALVQVVVDLLATVILVLALIRLPRDQRQQASEFTYRQGRIGLTRDLVLATGGGIFMTLLTVGALTSRPRQSLVTPFYTENAKVMTGATDIVGAIVVDFRAFDTLIEISVFSVAGYGIYSLLRYAVRKAGDRDEQVISAVGKPLHSSGMGGAHLSPLIRSLVVFALPVAILLAFTHILYGHDQPGDGFTAGVIVGLSVGLWYIVYGYHETRARLFWVKPARLIAIGLTMAAITALLPLLFGGSVFSHIDFGQMWGLPLPKGVGLSTSMFFELAICIAVTGGILSILSALGHPKDDEGDSELLSSASEGSLKP